jgi:hypothetical protein
MTKKFADAKPIPDSTLELIARLDPTFFPATSARRALAQDRPVSLGRHRRKCSVCQHPERDAIEEAFLHWHSPNEIAAQFGLPDWSSIYRHVRAFGLFADRRRNARFALENIIERANEIQVVTPSAIVAAARAFAHINKEGEWVDPPQHIVVTYVTVSEDSLAPPAVEEKPAAQPAAMPESEPKGRVEDAKAPKEEEKAQNEPVFTVSNRKSSLQSQEVNPLKTKEGS